LLQSLFSPNSLTCFKLKAVLNQTQAELLEQINIPTFFTNKKKLL
jgi:hypothetical protein